MFIIINIYSLILRNNKFPSKVLATRSESPLEKDLIEVVEPIFSIGGIKVSSLLVKLYKKSSFVFIWDQDAANCMYKALFYEGHGIFNLAADGAISNKDPARVLDKKYMALPAALLKFLLFLSKSTGLSKYGPEQLLFI